jgi:hypothetical protein
MSSIGDPPAKSMRAAHAHRKEQHDIIQAPSEEQPQSKLGETAVCAEVAAPAEPSQTAPKQEEPKPSKESSHEPPPRVLDSEAIQAMLNAPQTEPEQSFVTAPVSFTKVPMIFGSVTGKGSPPIPETPRDKGKQRAENDSPQGSNQSIASQLVHISKENEALKEEARKWSELAGRTPQELEAQKAEKETFRKGILLAYKHITWPTSTASEIDAPTVKGSSPALLHASQTTQATCGSTVETPGSERCYVVQASSALQEGIHLAQIEATLEPESPTPTVKEEESELSRVPPTPDTLYTASRQEFPSRSQILEILARS